MTKLASSSGFTKLIVRLARTVSKIGAALVGSGIAAVAFAVLLAQVLPIGLDGRFVAGFLLMAPLWIAGICWGFLMRSAWRAWVTFAAIAVLAAGATFAIKELRLSTKVARLAPSSGSVMRGGFGWPGASVFAALLPRVLPTHLSQ